MKQTGEERFPNIFKAGRIGKFTTSNRVKYGACCVSNYNDRDGTISERELARTRIIAQTGSGIITNQGAYPDEKGEGKSYYRQIAIYDDRFLPQFEKIAGWIHDAGAVAIQQILHTGRYGGVDIGYCVQPSAVPQTLPHFRPPREMTKEEIKQTLKDHALASARAIKAGFDGVEVTSFMGYLLANFLSKFTNRRTDEYGGSLENRARFMRELIYVIKEAIGDDHCLCVRLNGAELMDRYGGSDEEECLEIMKIAAKEGVDMISVTVGWQESPVSSIGRDVPPGHWNYLAARAKKEIPNVPIAFGVRLSDPEMAEKALAEGEIDFWEVCRPFLADPQRLHKVRENRVEDIRPCLGCNFCLSRLFRDIPYLCTVNTALGHEVEPEYHITLAALHKRIVVVGGGPAGMECAITAAQRGHEVHLYEATDKLGGQLRTYADSDLAHKEDLQRLLAYYETQVEKRGVKVHLNTRVTAELVRSLTPGDIDVVIVAAGSGLERDSRIMGVEKAVIAHDVLEGRVQPGRRVVVIGGGKVGLVTAEDLAAKGYEVVVVEEARRIAEDVMPTWKWRHTQWVEDLKIKVLTQARVREIKDGEVLAIDKTGNEVLLPADTVILANIRKSRQELLHQCEFMADETHIIGDAIAPRGLNNAIHDGYKMGVRI
ncbi:MAG: FAD-dependent oxidoreductase [Chloroflexi bacterium]|nr:FAD-dependent oxidoreductase [Chloroflexota bacterium]